MKADPDYEYWEVKARDVDSWFNYEVFVEIKDRGQKYVRTRWVLFIEDSPQTARLVNKCFSGVKASETAAEKFRPLVLRNGSKQNIGSKLQIKGKLNGPDMKLAF